MKTIPVTRFQSVMWAPVNQVVSMTNPVNFISDTFDWGYTHREGSVTLIDLYENDLREMLAFLDDVGLTEPFLYQDEQMRNPQGSPSGTGTVKAGQTGQSIATEGWDPGIELFKAGDEVVIMGRLFTILADVSSDPAGEATLSVWPEVPVAYPAGSLVLYGSDSWAVMLLSAVPDVTLTSPSKAGGIVISLIEYDAACVTSGHYFTASITGAGSFAPGASVTLTVAASADMGDLSFVWKHNGQVDSETSSVKAFVASFDLAGTWTCTVSTEYSTTTLAAYVSVAETVVLVQVDSSGSIVETTGNGTLTTVGAVVVDPSVTHDGYGSIRNAALGETRPYPPVYQSGVKVVSNDLDLPSFTIEGWFYILENRADNILIFFQLRSSTSGSEYFALMDPGTTNENVVVALGGVMDIEHKLTVPLNTWTHLAFSGESADGLTNVRYFVNGELVHTVTWPWSVAAGILTLGGPTDLYFPMGCCFENVRISSGVRYSEPFDPPGRFLA